jgi:hypothetical protein
VFDLGSSSDASFDLTRHFLSLWHDDEGVFVVMMMMMMMRKKKTRMMS